MPKKELFAFGCLKTYGACLANPIRFSKIDESNIEDHPRLTMDDHCLYLWEYTSGASYEASGTNSLIKNLKKKPSERLTKGGYHYKAAAIESCAKAFKQAFNPDWLNGATLVPVPGSKIAGDPDYDDRMVQICRLLREHADVRSIVYQSESTARAHEAGPGGRRLSVEDLLRVYRVDESLCTPMPKALGIFDDVLTAGTHFRAMKTVLSARFPGVQIVGIFVARRVFPDPSEVFA
jgi:hypothetical protein